MHQSYSTTSLWRNLEWVTTGSSPSNTFQVFSNSQKMTRKSVQYLVFIILVFHVSNCVLLTANVSRAQLFGLRGGRFSCIKYFLPPTPQEHLALLFSAWDTSLPTRHQPGEHPPSAWRSQYHLPCADASNLAGNASHCCQPDVLDSPCVSQVDIFKH